MSPIENMIAGFSPTTLGALSDIRLLKRYDTKFIFHRNQLDAVFDYLSGHYQVLEIENSRAFNYETLYYDTDDYFFYHQHHNKKLNRYKIRCRRYQQSNQCYFEIKFKNNRDKTFKSRLPLESGNLPSDLPEESIVFAKERMINGDGCIVDKLSPKLKVDYTRITLASHANQERLTVDTDLTYIDRNNTCRRFENLIIAELKSEKVSLNSPLCRQFRELKIFPANFSKYCMGIVTTEENVKRNSFKQKIMKLNKFS